MPGELAYSLSCRQLHPDPELGPLKHDHKLTLIFFSLHEGDLSKPWIKRGDPTVIWPRDWLPKEEEGLGNNILVLSVECYVEPKKEFSVPWPLEKILVRDLVMNTKWELNRAQTIVLVGHGLGGLVIKSLIESFHFHEPAQKEQKARWEAFQQNIKGIVFYSVPHTTSQEEFVHYCESYTKMIENLDKDFKYFKGDMVFLNTEFESTIYQKDINLFAFVEGQKVAVPESSTYKLVQKNVCEIEDADHFQVSQPFDQQHASYKRLLQFIQQVLQSIEEVLVQSQNLDVIRRTIEDLAQTRNVNVMIRTIEDVHIKSPKDFKPFALKRVLGKTAILCVGGKRIEGDSVEFLFMHAGDMAKVVGVGLDCAKVVVTKKLGVNVVQEDEEVWTKLWRLEHFVPRIISIPNPSWQERRRYSNSAKRDGVELKAFLGRVYVEEEKEKHADACFPLVFELMEHIGFGREEAMKMKEVSGEGSSGSTGEGSSGSTEDRVNIRRQLKRKFFATSSGSREGGEEDSRQLKRNFSATSSGSRQEGGEVLGGESSGFTKDGEVSRVESNESTKGEAVSKARSSGSRQEIRRNEDVEGFEDPSRGPPNPLDPSLSTGQEDVEEKSLTVNVFPKARQLARALGGRASPPSICPTLVFKFQRKGQWRMIDVEAETQCNFGKMQIGAPRNGLGYYQDNITISLDCIDEGYDGARVRKTHVQHVENVKKTITVASTAIHSSTHEVGGRLELDATRLPHDLALHAEAKYKYAWTGGDNRAHGNTQEICFSQLDCFFVDDHSMESELRYNFRYPQEVLQDIALGDSSKIKTDKTFRPTIVSNWANLNMNDESPYIFNVERHIVSKNHLKKSFKCEGEPPFTQKHYEVSFNEIGPPDTSMITQSLSDIRLNTNEGSEVPVIKQCYKVNFKVNHAMTHIRHKTEVTHLRHSDTDPMIVDRVMKMSSPTSE